MRTFSADVQQGILSVSTSVILLDILDIDHPLLSSPLHLVNNSENISVNGQEYTALGMRVDHPEEKDGARFSAKVEIDNVNQLLTTALRSLSGDFTVTIRTVSASDLTASPPEFDNIEIEALPMQATSVTYDQETASFDLSYKSIATEKFPSIEFNEVNFPGGDFDEG